MRYDRTGMNCSFCANAAVVPASSARPSKADLNAFIFLLLTRQVRGGRDGTARSSMASRSPLGRDDTSARAPARPAAAKKSVRERPEPQLLLGDLPEASEAVRLDD